MIEKNIEIITKYKGIATSMPKRTTCDHCGKRRICRITWLQYSLYVVNRFPSETKIDVGDLCTECERKLRAGMEWANYEVTP